MTAIPAPRRPEPEIQAILALSRGNQEQRTRFVQGLRQSSAASPHRVRTPDGRGSRHNRRQRAIRESLGS